METASSAASARRAPTPEFKSARAGLVLPWTWSRATAMKGSIRIPVSCVCHAKCAAQMEYGLRNVSTTRPTTRAAASAIWAMWVMASLAIAAPMVCSITTQSVGRATTVARTG